MNCREARDRLFAERDGALSEAHRGQLASHLAECAACRRVRADLESGIGAAQAKLANDRIPDADIEWTKVRRALRERAEHRRWSAGWLALPAAVAAAAAVGVYLRTAAPSRPTVNETVAAAATPSASPTTAPAAVAAESTPATAPADAAASTSTVVYIDDRSGWTFVWDDDGSRSRI